MKFPRTVWSVALCLSGAVALTLGFRGGPTGAPSNSSSSPHNWGQDNNTAPVQPFGHLMAASLQQAAVAAPVLLAGEPAPGQQAASTAKPRPGPDLPPIEEFVLIPPNRGLNIYKTQLSVKFSGESERLAARIPLTLGDQDVVLQRSADDYSIYSAAIDFDWKAFAREQQQRKDLADTGRQIPVFDGHQFVRMDKIHFVDPEDIRSALQSHQPIQFTPQILEGTDFTIQPAQELMIVDPSVVEDPTRTYDPCTGIGNPQGAWTFGTLMTALANNQVDPATMVENWLNNWNQTLVINTFKVNPRPNMQNRLLNTWPRTGGKLDLVNAPMRLNAIVNRLDLGQTGNLSTGGELRFIFGATSPCPNGLGKGGEASPRLFDIILEYTVPRVLGCNQVNKWAKKWHALDNDPNYNQDLQNITDLVVTISGGASANLNRLRTNETLFSGATTPPPQAWEMREFLLSSGTLVETTMGQTPQGDPLGTDWNGFTCQSNTPTCNSHLLTQWINANQSQIVYPGFYSVPATYNGLPFAGATAFQPLYPPGSTWWNVAIGDPIDPRTRRDFSTNTCNACHGRETATSFEQAANRPQGKQAALAGFLVGCNGTSGQDPHDCSANPRCPLTAPCTESVLDPGNDPNRNSFGDILRRETVMSNVLSSCNGSGLLQGLVLHKVSFVH
jgi:hypothetical protein